MCVFTSTLLVDVVEPPVCGVSNTNQAMIRRVYTLWECIVAQTMQLLLLQQTMIRVGASCECATYFVKFCSLDLPPQAHQNLGG